MLALVLTTAFNPVTTLGDRAVSCGSAGVTLSNHSACQCEGSGRGVESYLSSGLYTGIVLDSTSTSRRGHL